MSSASFDLEETRLMKEIQRRKAKLVFVQLPDGLKPHGPRLALKAEKAGALAIVSADPCYGACDLAVDEAQRLGADLLIHYGHSKMLTQTAIPTVHIEATANVSVEKAAKEAISLLKPWTRIGLVTTVQHVRKLDEARNVLASAGKTVKIGDAGKQEHPGQVIGCDYSNAKVVSHEVEAFLFVGGGKFHALGVKLATSKPTVAADPFEKRAFKIEDEAKRILKRRLANIVQAEKAEAIGIIVSLKHGQKRLDQALTMKKYVEESGKKAVLLAMKEITPEALMQFQTADAFINTGCPRLCIDDQQEFRRPLLTPREALVTLAKLEWEELCGDGWFES